MRSYTMSRIRSRDTSIETVFRKALWHSGVRYRKNYKALPGTPDIAITKYRVAVFCDGEFWHGKDWETKQASIHSNRDFWINKIQRNMIRDNAADITLRQMGWVSLHFWGEDIKKHLDLCVREVRDAIFQVGIEEFADMDGPGG
ncbi:MAG: very short patch repair endonuclease [Lachnospiraceae bacterium]|nr:very short patch repair endonuclease [Lachnospiraceae bacterium]